jgi:hypothetical protein
MKLSKTASWNGGHNPDINSGLIFTTILEGYD